MAKDKKDAVLAELTKSLGSEPTMVDVKTLPFATRAEMLGKEVAPIFDKYGINLTAQVLYQDKLAVPEEGK